jgi:hypothetical protein
LPGPGGPWTLFGMLWPATLFKMDEVRRVRPPGETVRLPSPGLSG